MRDQLMLGGLLKTPLLLLPLPLSYHSDLYQAGWGYPLQEAASNVMRQGAPVRVGGKWVSPALSSIS